MCYCCRGVLHEHEGDPDGCDRRGHGGGKAARQPAAPTRSPTLVLVAAMMGIILVTLDVSVVNVAVQSIGPSLRTEVNGLQWVLNGYTLAYAVLLLSAGAL